MAGRPEAGTKRICCRCTALLLKSDGSSVGEVVQVVDILVRCSGWVGSVALGFDVV